MGVVNKYAVGLLQVAIILVTSLGAALSDNDLTAVEAFQVGALVIGAVVSVFVPLLQGPWAAGLKVGGAALGAVLAAIVPIVDTNNGGPGWTASAIMIVVLAGLNALATQLGVDVRIDSVKAQLAAPEVSDRVPVAVDKPAVDVVVAHAGPAGSVG
jgi:hypothetical protein